MATREYLGQVGARPQIDTITIGGTWTTGETASVTIGNATLTVAVGSDTLTTALVASALSAAINATTITSGLIGKEVRYAAGQLLPEFRDVESQVDPDSSSRVIVRSKVPGTPFGTPSGGNMTVAEGSSAGTIARASVQTATGPNDYTNTANWSTATVPITGDDIVAKAGANGPKYNLPTTTQMASITIAQSVDSGWSFGLPDINTAGGLPYPEYRTKAATWDNAHSAATRYTIGQGSGSGPSLMRFAHGGTDTLQFGGIVYNTGTPLTGMSHALYLSSGATNSGDLAVLRGRVALAAFAGETCGLGTETTNGLEVGYIADATQASDANVLIGEGVNIDETTVLAAGGVLDLRCDVKDVSTVVSQLIVAGSASVFVSGNGTTSPKISHLVSRYGSTVSLLSEATLDESVVLEGVLDLRAGLGAVTVTAGCTLDVRSTGVIYDPRRRLTLDNFVWSGWGRISGA